MPNKDKGTCWDCGSRDLEEVGGEYTRCRSCGATDTGLLPKLGPNILSRHRDLAATQREGRPASTGSLSAAVVNQARKRREKAKKA
jgi:hypothetical protein